VTLLVDRAEEPQVLADRVRAHSVLLDAPFVCSSSAVSVTARRGMLLRREDEGAERTFRRTDEAIIAQSPMAEIALSGLEPEPLGN